MELSLGFSEGGKQLFLPKLLQYPWKEEQEVPMPVARCSEIEVAAGRGVGVGYYFGAQRSHLLQPCTDAAVSLMSGYEVQDVYDQHTRLNDGFSFPALATRKRKKQKKKSQSVRQLESWSWRELKLQIWSLLRYVGQAKEKEMQGVREGIFRIRLLYSDFGSQSRAGGHFDPDGFRLLHLMVKPMEEVSASSDRSHLFAYCLHSDSDEGHDDVSDGGDTDDGPGSEEGQQERGRSGLYYYYQLLVLLLLALLLLVLLLLVLLSTTTSTLTPTTTITITTTTTTTTTTTPSSTTYYQFNYYY
jgi:hypothetical protein